MGDNKDRTLWCGNLNGDITEELLHELFVQAGPLDSVRIPDGKNFAFVAFQHADSVPYTMELMKGVVLCNQQLRLQFRPGSIHAEGGQQHQPQQQWGQQGSRGGYNKQMAMGNQQMGNQQMAMGHQMGVGNQKYVNNQMMSNQMGNQGYNSLRPPMAGMLQNTDFLRSCSTPNLGSNYNSNNNHHNNSSNNNASPLMGRRDGHRPGLGDRGSRDSLSETGRYKHQQQEHQHRHDSRTSSHDRSHSHDQGQDRHGGDRKRRHHDRDGGPQRDSRSSSSCSSPGEMDLQQVQKQASQNFRRGMVSPPWKRSTAPWEQS